MALTSVVICVLSVLSSIINGQFGNGPFMAPPINTVGNGQVAKRQEPSGMAVVQEPGNGIQPRDIQVQVYCSDCTVEMYNISNPDVNQTLPTFIRNMFPFLNF
ncbi:unnamed protein product [Enterobius vermicularis]|uniref:Uncharacterized protein n=1 Tax=Enterobius vermicularis TaxID=51028 RepID=A0A0N4VKW8_ENTVE|nr:unnamed protein product [Enterobius vermicularis]